MKRFLLIVITIYFAVSYFGAETFAQRQKLAQTGLKFLSYPTDARASALGESYTSLSSGSGAMFYNPSTMSSFEQNIDVTVGVSPWIADIKYLYGAIAIDPMKVFGVNSNIGRFGISLMSVDYGDFIGTIVDGSATSGYREVGTFRPKAMAVGLGYAVSLSDKFSVGANIKYVYQNLGSSVIDLNKDGSLINQDNSIGTVAYDFGILYHTGFKSLDFGMSVRNFSAELKYKDEGFQLPLTFKIGLSVNAFDFIDIDSKMHKLLLSLDVSHPRDYPEQVFVGAEYSFNNWIAFRGGFSAPNDERKYSVGVGLKPEIVGTQIGLDYSYTPFGIFSDVHNFSFRFNF